MFVPKAEHANIHRRGDSGMRLDYHECDNVDDLVRILNEIAGSCFILEKVIHQPGDSFVVLFRRYDFG